VGSHEIVALLVARGTRASGRCGCSSRIPDLLRRVGLEHGEGRSSGPA
jgi:hypothetical protein